MKTRASYLAPGRDQHLLSQAAAWGKEDLCLDFCGGPYWFSGLSPAQARAIRERYALYVLDTLPRGQAVHTHLLKLAEEDFRHIETQGWTYERMGYHYGPETLWVEGLKLLAELSPGSRMSGLLGTPLDDHDWFPGLVFENYFRLLTAYRLLTLGGVMLHSAGILGKDGRARLFLGHSGAGKSTLSAMAHEQGLGILSDDLNVVLPREGKLWVEKVPFTGTFAQQADSRRSWPLEGIYKLVQGKENRLEALGPGAALSLLLSCSPFVNQDPYRFTRLSDNLMAILEQSRTHTLVFNRDGSCFSLL